MVFAIKALKPWLVWGDEPLGCTVVEHFHKGDGKGRVRADRFTTMKRIGMDNIDIGRWWYCMGRQGILGDTGLRRRRYGLVVYKVLDVMAKAHATVGDIAFGLMVMAVVIFIVVLG